MWGNHWIFFSYKSRYILAKNLLRVEMKVKIILGPPSSSIIGINGATLIFKIMPSGKVSSNTNWAQIKQDGMQIQTGGGWCSVNTDIIKTILSLKVSIYLFSRLARYNNKSSDFFACGLYLEGCGSGSIIFVFGGRRRHSVPFRWVNLAVFRKTHRDGTDSLWKNSSSLSFASLDLQLLNHTELLYERNIFLIGLK